MSITLRQITAENHEQAIALWNSVFNVDRSYFELYYSADPWYSEGDTFGAWDETGALVSAVHVCRRPITNASGRTLMCAGIANVATLPDFRSRGLSKQLLNLAIDQFKSIGFDFSLLGTGVPKHYAQLGWELAHMPTSVIDLPIDRVSEPETSVTDLSNSFQDIYRSAPRPIQNDRSDEYFSGWCSGRLKEFDHYIVSLTGEAYAVVEISTNDAGEISVTVVEYCAPDRNAELSLLKKAARSVPSGVKELRLWSPPQFLEAGDLEPFSIRPGEPDSGSMIRNISMSESEYCSVKEAYADGRAAWWRIDHF